MLLYDLKELYFHSLFYFSLLYKQKISDNFATAEVEINAREGNNCVPLSRGHRTLYRLALERMNRDHRNPANTQICYFVYTKTALQLMIQSIPSVFIVLSAFRRICFNWLF